MSTADEVFDTWEEMEASGALDRKLNALQLDALEVLDDRQNPKLAGNNTTNGRMIILGEDGVRSQYVPPRPTVKILKRPQRDSQTSGDGLANGEKPKQPIKSLKQREQEYAEARKRILGEERSPDEKSASEIAKIQPKTSQTPNPICQPSFVPIYPTSIPTCSPIPNVIRLPTGPDGTRGFNLRR